MQVQCARWVHGPLLVVMLYRHLHLCRNKHLPALPQAPLQAMHKSHYKP